MIEIAAGLLVMLMTVVLASGVGPATMAPFALGLGGMLLGTCAGLALIGHALFRKAVRASAGDTHWRRTTGLMGAMLVIVVTLALTLPALTAPLGLVKIGGFPLGYYVAAQGVPVALVIVLFLFARRQHAIDTDHNGTLE